KPFLSRRCRLEGLDIAPQVKPEAAPVSGRQERHLDALRQRRSQLEVCVLERMLQSALVDIREIAGKQLRIERRAGRDRAGKAIAVGAVGVSVLVDRDLGVPKQLKEKGRVD